MIIRLPNERSIIVDSKVPLAAYLDAMQSDNADVQSERMVAHARHLRSTLRGFRLNSIGVSLMTRARVCRLVCTKRIYF